MMPKTPLFFLLILMWALFCAPPAFSLDGPDEDAQFDELRSVAPNVFLDCSRRDCDLDYIRTEITFVNYVRDPQSSDVHILVTRQSTGSGGREYTLSFIGKGKYEGRDSSLTYYSKSTDTQDQIRSGFVNVMKQGLIPYLYDTPLSEFITVSYTQKPQRQIAPVRDKWNNWVFYVSFRGNLNFEEQSKRYSYSGSFSANATGFSAKYPKPIDKTSVDLSPYCFPI